MKVHDLGNNYQITPALTENFKVQFCSIIVFLFYFFQMSLRNLKTGLMSVLKVKNAPLIVPLNESLWLVIDQSPSDFM